MLWQWSNPVQDSIQTSRVLIVFNIYAHIHEHATILATTMIGHYWHFFDHMNLVYVPNRDPTLHTLSSCDLNIESTLLIIIEHILQSECKKFSSENVGVDLNLRLGTGNLHCIDKLQRMKFNHMHTHFVIMISQDWEVLCCSHYTFVTNRLLLLIDTYSFTTGGARKGCWVEHLNTILHERWHTSKRTGLH